MSKRSKACAIPPAVRAAVEFRDGWRCIYCKAAGRGEAHIVPRSQGGLGVPENIVTICRQCHDWMDNGLRTQEYYDTAVEYIKQFYPDWSEENVKYNKWGSIKGGRA